MRFLSTYQEVCEAGWGQLLLTSPYATWFQSPEAYRFYGSLTKEMMPFVFGVSENEQLMGVIAGYITCERSAVKQFFSRRAIIMGGALLDEHISDDALTALLSNMLAVLRRKTIYIEVRNLHDYSQWKELFADVGLSYMPHLNFQVRCNHLEPLMKDFKSNRKRQVRKALDGGATIIESPTIAQVTDFYHLLKRLYAHKVRTPLPSLDFFLNFYNQHLGKFLLISYENRIIGGMMCPVLANHTIYEWYVCGLDKQYRKQYPSVLVTYAAIRYAAANNIPTFDFMGAGVPDVPYGVRTFKSRFGGVQVEYGRFLYVCSPLLYRLGKLIMNKYRGR